MGAVLKRRLLTQLRAKRLKNETGENAQYQQPWIVRDGDEKDDEDIPINSLYHMCVMPCFDKKLEGSREDFRDQNGERDVDIVLSTGELQQYLLDEVVDLCTFVQPVLSLLIFNNNLTSFINTKSCFLSGR